MDPRILVEKDVEIGRQAIKALDAASFPITAALWHHHSEEDEWLLAIASPLVEKQGSAIVYQEIHKVLESAGVPLPLMRISALTPYDPIVLNFRIGAATPSAPYLGGTYYYRAPVGPRYVIGAFLYRAERLVPVSGTQSLLALVRDKPAKLWRVFPGTLTFKDGLLQQAHIEGHELLHKQGNAGLTTRIHILHNPRRYKRQPIGDVKRMVFDNGRLEDLEDTDRRVRIEGVPAMSTP